MHWPTQFPVKHLHPEIEALIIWHLLNPHHHVDVGSVVEGIHGHHHHALLCADVSEVESYSDGEKEGPLEDDGKD